VATPDEAQLGAWAARWPGANWGVATGRTSGFFVLDVDGPEGVASLDAHGPRPRTATQETGRGGLHLLFRLPDFPVGNSVKRLADGLDVRGDGGQIVLAPSVTTGPYRWLAPPWELAPQVAPGWLLERLRELSRGRPASGAGGAGGAGGANPPPPERGFWPAASPEVLEAARAALVEHGPAVEGQGGDDHTLRAAAILAHDHALTDDEAWPLFEAWNLTCAPPWSTEDLRRLLSNGRRYGKKPWGCARQPDALEAGRAALATWAGVDVREAQALVAPYLTAIRDPLTWDMLAAEYRTATGRVPMVPKPKAESRALEQGEIQLGTDLHRVADEASAAIAPLLFQRAGRLCEVVQLGMPVIRDLAVPGVLDYLSRAARWLRYDEKQGLVPTSPPAVIASVVLERPRAGVRQLDAVTTSPVLLPDGSILQDRGYSELARVWLEPSVQVQVQDWPTREEARAAVAVLKDIFREFLFRSEADFSVVLAAVLSPLVKPAIHNAPAPLVVVSAASPGAGKSLLTDVIVKIASGQPPAIRPYTPGSSEEWMKKLTSYVLAGPVINVFDNVVRPIGDEGLDILLTANGWADRLLGSNAAPVLPLPGVWMASGNNVAVQGDTVRRVLVVRLEVDRDRPQERPTERGEQGLRDEVDRRRAELLGSALTILRAYCVAGRPEVGLPPWGSFPAWSGLVRGALVWAGCADPYETQRRAQDELTEEDHETHDFWIAAVRASDGTLPGVLGVALAQDAEGTLGLRGPLTTHTVRRRIARFVDKPRLGQRIRRTETGGYSIERISS